MEVLIILFVVCSGLVLGSFFNVLIWRLPRHESIISPPSHCPKCNRPVRPWENIPIISYLLLRGKCAGCGQSISLQYPLVELGTAGAALLLWYTVAESCSSGIAHDTHLALQCFALLLMIPVTVIDLRHWIIPNEITYPLLGAAIAASLLPGDTTPMQSVFGAIIGGGMLLGIGWLGKIIFRKDAMGWGDIKLLAAAGALWGTKIVFLTFIFGSLLGTIGAGVFVISRRLRQDHLIPFGPFLALGLWIAVLWGSGIMESYMNFTTRIIYPR